MLVRPPVVVKLHKLIFHAKHTKKKYAKAGGTLPAKKCLAFFALTA